MTVLLGIIAALLAFILITMLFGKELAIGLLKILSVIAIVVFIIFAIIMSLSDFSQDMRRKLAVGLITTVYSLPTIFLLAYGATKFDVKFSKPSNMWIKFIFIVSCIVAFFPLIFILNWLGL